MKDQLIGPKELRDLRRDLQMVMKSLYGSRPNLIIERVDPLAEYHGDEIKIDFKIQVWDAFGPHNTPLMKFGLDTRMEMSLDERITKLMRLQRVFLLCADRVFEECMREDQDTSQVQRATHFQVREECGHDNTPPVNFELIFQKGMSRDEAIIRLIMLATSGLLHPERVVEESMREDQDTSQVQRVTH